jgi:hypothetical protein
LSQVSIPLHGTDVTVELPRAAQACIGLLIKQVHAKEVVDVIIGCTIVAQRGVIDAGEPPADVVTIVYRLFERGVVRAVKLFVHQLAKFSVIALSTLTTKVREIFMSSELT